MTTRWQTDAQLEASIRDVIQTLVDDVLASREARNPAKCDARITVDEAHIIFCTGGVHTGEHTGMGITSRYRWTS